MAEILDATLFGQTSTWSDANKMEVLGMLMPKLGLYL